MMVEVRLGFSFPRRKIGVICAGRRDGGTWPSLVFVVRMDGWSLSVTGYRLGNQTRTGKR